MNGYQEGASPHINGLAELAANELAELPGSFTPVAGPIRDSYSNGSQ
jgi:hypothetical protein